MYSDSALSLVVPSVVIVLVFITKRITLSLFLGIVVAGIMMSYDDIFGIFTYIFMHIGAVFYDTSDSNEITLKQNSFFVFGFLIILGILTQLMLHSGGVAAFIKWARNKIKTAKGSEFLAFIAGIIIFIDDYFNALTVGQISKQLNDANGSTRERLAYIIDSTSAPICILMPISSWGAYIITILEDKNLSGSDGSFLTLLHTISHNYYAWFALLAVFLTIYWQINFKAMRTHKNIGVTDYLKVGNTHSSSSVWLLILPVGILIVSITIMIFWSGYQVCKEFDFIAMLQNTQTGFALFWGGLCALGISIVISIKHLDTDSIIPIIKYGILSMLPAILILIFAWAIGPVINDDMQTGKYLALLSQQYLTSHAGVLLPIVIFGISGFIGFATGTSWGTFAIMLPIAAGVASASSLDYILAISAVLSGAVYGDHASPISDTTILSATGAGCSPQSHFITQLPYVSIVAIISALAFVIASFSSSIILGYGIGISALVGIFYYCKRAQS